MNFVVAYEAGKRGENIGLTTGMLPLDRAIGGVQKKAMYVVAAGPKVGKSTFVDMCFVIEPMLEYMENLKKNPEMKMRAHWIYFSFEISRVEKEAKFMAYFFYKDYGLNQFDYNGEMVEISANYLLGKTKSKTTGLPILVTPEHDVIVKQLYKDRIVPIFGKYDGITGNKIVQGLMDCVEQRANPTGMRNYILHYAKDKGTFIKEKYTTRDEKENPITKERTVGYKPKNPELYTIIITDHVRKLYEERGYNMKQLIDKWAEYQVELRNWCSFTFVNVVHINRALASVERIKFMKETLYPTGDDIKDTGNLSEDANFVITLFNPKDEKYNIDVHFGIQLDNYPNYRSIHLVESRGTPCPQHLATQMYGNINLFKPIE